MKVIVPEDKMSEIEEILTLIRNGCKFGVDKIRIYRNHTDICNEERLKELIHSLIREFDPNLKRINEILS